MKLNSAIQGILIGGALAGRDALAHEARKPCFTHADVTNIDRGIVLSTYLTERYLENKKPEEIIPTAHSKKLTSFMNRIMSYVVWKCGVKKVRLLEQQHEQCHPNNSAVNSEMEHVHLQGSPQQISCATGILQRKCGLRTVPTAEIAALQPGETKPIENDTTYQQRLKNEASCENANSR